MHRENEIQRFVGKWSCFSPLIFSVALVIIDIDTIFMKTDLSNSFPCGTYKI